MRKKNGNQLNHYLKKWKEILDSTWLHCPFRKDPEDPSTFDAFAETSYCVIPIMGKQHDRVNADDVVKKWVDRMPSQHTMNEWSTLVIGMSAHIMSTYTLGEFENMLHRISERVKVYDGGHVFIWRENWTMHENVILPNEYTPPAPADAVALATRDKGIGKKLTEPQAAYHRSMVLSLLNHATEGKIRLAPSYWASKAWLKDMQATSSDSGGRQDMRYDMRHMGDAVVAATIMGLVDLW